MGKLIPGSLVAKGIWFQLALRDLLSEMWQAIKEHMLKMNFKLAAISDHEFKHALKQAF